MIISLIFRVVTAATVAAVVSLILIHALVPTISAWDVLGL